MEVIRLLPQLIPNPAIRARIFRNNCLILFHKAVYRFYLCRKRLLLARNRIRMRLSLLKAERQLVAKYGRNWREGVLNYERVQALKVFEYVHSVMTPNEKS